MSKHARRTGKDMRAFIREEVNYQEQIEADGYRSPSWRILRALKNVHGAEQLQGESAVAAPPFFRSAGRGERVFWGRGQGPTVFVWESLDASGRKRCEEVTQSTRNWVVWSRANPRRGRDEARAYITVGKALFEGKARPADSENKDDQEGESSEEEREDGTSHVEVAPFLPFQEHRPRTAAYVAMQERNIPLFYKFLSAAILQAAARHTERDTIQASTFHSEFCRWGRAGNYNTSTTTQSKFGGDLAALMRELEEKDLQQDTLTKRRHGAAQHYTVRWAELQTYLQETARYDSNAECGLQLCWTSTWR